LGRRKKEELEFTECLLKLELGKEIKYKKSKIKY